MCRQYAPVDFMAKCKFLISGMLVCCLKCIFLIICFTGRELINKKKNRLNTNAGKWKRKKGRKRKLNKEQKKEMLTQNARKII
jgi:hypothetical protein